MKIYVKSSKVLGGSAGRIFSKADAYWISPTGKVLPVKQKHITEIVTDPVAFGFSQEEIEEIHEKYGEPLGVEGKAREELMNRLLKLGWIRIRYVPRQDMYSIQCANFRKRQKDYLWYWANDVMENKHHQYADVRLETQSGVERTNIRNLLSSEILCSVSPVGKRRDKISYIRESWEFLEIPLILDDREYDYHGRNWHETSRRGMGFA